MSAGIQTYDEKHASAEEVEYDGKLKAEQQEHGVGDVVMLSGTGTVRRIPIPSDDPNDPLQFSKLRKIGIIFTCCWFSNFSLLSISGIGTFFHALFQLYIPAQTPSQVVGLSTYSSLVMAFGCLVLLPLAIVFGRRPIFLLAILVAFGASIGGATNHSYEGHLTSRMFLGLATGATESLLPLIITDVTFLDERSFYFGIYWGGQSVISTALIIALSYATAALSWRWFYWIFVITLAVGTVLVFFLNPETKFYRSPTALNGQVVYTDEFGATHILSDEEAEARFGSLQEHVESSETTQKRTFWQNLALFTKPAPGALKVWLGVYVKILECCTSPGVIFSTMASSIALGIGIAVSLIYSNILIENYNWSAGSVGLFNAGVIPASFASMFYSGYCAEKINIWLAKRNGGVHIAEHHLVHLIIPCITGAIGIIAIGITANDPKKHSVWGLLIGWAIYQFSFVCILITTSTFAAEVIPNSPGAAMVVVIGGKNIVSFAASYGLIPMVAKYSLLKAFMILLGVYLGIFALGIPVYFLNRVWKRKAL